MNDNVDINFQSPFRVGDWTIDPANNLIQLGEQVVNVEPKVMDVLVYLAERQGQVISREQLEDNVWPGRVVSYDALTNSIVKLRKALKSSKENPIIKTVPKRGYSLVAAVTAISAEDTSEAKPDENQLTENTQESYILPANSQSDPERRQVSVLSCELLNADSIYKHMDPEDVHELLQQLQQSCSDVVNHFGGHIGQYANGEMVIYYGFPEAHEGDAERAIRTALGLVDTVNHMAEKLPAIKQHLSLRMGIHTGIVVVAENTSGNAQERLSMVGDTPAIADGLKKLAQVNTVVISESTKRLVDKLFSFDLLQPVVSSDLPTQKVYRVQSLPHTPSRSETTFTETLTPLVGRDVEIDLLMQRWVQSKYGDSQVVMLCAESGIGKSRILQGLQERLQDEDIERILYFCSPYHTNSSLYPVTVQLQRALDIQLNDDTKKNLDKLEAYLNELDLVVSETAPVFAELLSLPTSERYPDFRLRAEEIKKLTLECLLQMFHALAQRKPVLLILEDAHWIDPTTRELFDLLINELRSQPVFFVNSYRPEFDPPWSAYMQATLLRLNRLSKQESIGVIENITAGRALPENILDLIIARTDGVPLFVEELTRSILSSGALQDSDDGLQLTGSLQTINIPESLQDSLMARLDKLKHAKHIAQIAATIGRSFSHDLLVAVVREEDMYINHALTELVDEELLFRRGMQPDITYEFKHALVQDAAYQSLLKSRRQQYHRRIAEVLEQQFPHIVKSQPEVLAHHYTEAQQPQQAINYWLRAGKRASEHSANIEAIAHLNKGLELLKQTSESEINATQRDELELLLLLALGPVLLSAKGLGSSDAESVYLRARELCREAHANDALFTVTWGLWLLCQKRGRVKEAQDLSKELLALADKLKQPAYDLEAHHAAWTTNFRLSHFESTKIHSQIGIKLYDIKQHSNHASRFGGHDPGCCALYNAGMTAWLLGYPEQAQARAQQSVHLAKQINHLMTQALANIFAGFVAQWCKDVKTMKEHAQAVVSLCTKHGIAPDCKAQAQVLTGWAETVSADKHSGDITKGIADIEEAIKALRFTGVRTHEAYLLSLLADAYLRTHQAEQGLRTISDALSSIAQTGERTFEAEVYRLKGELLLLESAGNYDAAIDNFNTAISLAQQQQSKSLELRAVTSQVRAQNKHALKQKTAKPDIDQLSEIINWFTEGKDLPDQKEADELVEILGQVILVKP